MDNRLVAKDFVDVMVGDILAVSRNYGLRDVIVHSPSLNPFETQTLRISADNGDGVRREATVDIEGKMHLGHRAAMDAIAKDILTALESLTPTGGRVNQYA